MTGHEFRKIILEASRGESSTHALVDLAYHQAKTFGHGEIVDADDYIDLVGKGLDFARGNAKSPLRMTEVKLRRLIRKIIIDATQAIF